MTGWLEQKQMSCCNGDLHHQYHRQHGGGDHHNSDYHVVEADGDDGIAWMMSHAAENGNVL